VGYDVGSCHSIVQDTCNQIEASRKPGFSLYPSRRETPNILCTRSKLLQGDCPRHADYLRQFLKLLVNIVGAILASRWAESSLPLFTDSHFLWVCGHWNIQADLDNALQPTRAIMVNAIGIHALHASTRPFFAYSESVALVGQASISLSSCCSLCSPFTCCFPSSWSTWSRVSLLPALPFPLPDR